MTVILSYHLFADGMEKVMFLSMWHEEAKRFDD